ncbi:hypothetical protein COCMIDRAFT_38106 [Bipolaris oryzae ATCC 44560]|uniref:Uncharacterized protein n=1 Tax=Bipolaris oryzae ATCC 44560 TaxID=930090 RepID=W6Z8U9_COCMI|nr:uncharacterized protein COCMIDRAFT_38106 [Bipolaris oryzae ATCC 44560]EUC43979.1 hypothetical protein COCMIDRAFT_38106 [Bipolaris oryzae ATCC 44560]
MAYSPFEPYRKFDNRKQQFAPTALVMGPIQLTLKNVAWTEQRIIHVTNPLPWLCDILALALALVPLPAEKGAGFLTHQREEKSNDLAGYAGNMRRSAMRFMVVTLGACLLVCYAALVFDEIYKYNKGKVVSAIQGSDEDWPVQIARGIYYITSTVIFTSITAVTIIELVVWVLTFCICLLFEETGQRT